MMQESDALSDIEIFNHLQAAVNKNSQDIPSQILLGAMMFEPFHETSKAIAVLEKAIEREPNNVDAHFWLAKCFYHDYVDVEQTQVILQNALLNDAKRADCLSLMASVITDLGGSPKQRFGYLEQAVNQAPDWISPRQYLAQTLLELEDIDKAYAEVIIALSFVNTQKEIQPSNPVEAYYESAVTGRTWPDAKQELIHLHNKIRKKREPIPQKVNQPQMGQIKAIPVFAMSIS
jgi:tetratricopeptide (TPR) repeat protein